MSAEHCKAHAPADRAGLIPVSFELLLIADGLHALFHALVEGIRVQFVLGEGIYIAHGHQVLPAEGQRLHAQALADVVDMALPGPHGLGDAVGPHGAGGRPVGEYGPAVALHVVAGVQLREGAHALCHHTVAVGGVSALVGKGLELPGHQRTVRPDIGDDMGADGVADPVGDERLLPAALQLHQAAAYHGGTPGAQRLIQRVLLIASHRVYPGLMIRTLPQGRPSACPTTRRTM